MGNVVMFGVVFRFLGFFWVTCHDHDLKKFHTKPQRHNDALRLGKITGDAGVLKVTSWNVECWLANEYNT